MSTLFFYSFIKFQKKYKIQGIRKKEKRKKGKGEKKGGNKIMVYKQGKGKYRKNNFHISLVLMQISILEVFISAISM